jgi:hypothetical protein
LPFVRKEYEDFSNTVNSTCICKKIFWPFLRRLTYSRLFIKG